MPYSEFLYWHVFYKLEREAMDDDGGERKSVVEQSPQDQAEGQIAFLEAYQAKVTGKWQSFRELNNSKQN